MAGDTGRYWDPLVMQQEPSPVEKQLRDKFVTEYLKDCDAYLAALRVGYVQGVAATYASALINDSYVQQEIARRRNEAPPAAIAKQEVKSKKHRLESLLWELAHTTGKGTLSARVAAAAKLCNIYGMDGVSKIQSEITHKGGVMLVPGIAKVEDWESQAAAQQQKLVEDSSEDRDHRPPVH